MKWLKYTINTTTEAVDLVSDMLGELGIEGIEIQDNVPLTESDTKGMFIDILPELPPDEGNAQVSFYLDDDTSEEEIEGVTSYIKKSSKAEYNAEIEESIKRIATEEIAQGKKAASDGDDDGLNVDSKMEEAIQFVIESGQASTSMLQRRQKVGYARAGRMIDDMEQLGVVGPHQGSKPRDVLMTYSEWLERRNALQNREE